MFAMPFSTKEMSGSFLEIGQNVHICPISGLLLGPAFGRVCRVLGFGFGRVFGVWKIIGCWIWVWKAGAG